MFRRPVMPLVLCVTASVVVAVVGPAASGCRGKDTEKSAGSAAPAAAPKPPAPYELTPPPRYQAVDPKPPLVGAWEAPTQKNGFTPTINVVRRRLPAGTAEQVYTTWKDELLGVLSKQYKDVKILDERELEAGPHKGKLIVLVVTLPIPGNETPMPLFTYGATFQTDTELWVLGALTGASLDAQDGKITPVGEPEILNALASFRLK